MGTFRRALVAMGLAALLAVLLQLRGHGGWPPRRGGWRQLEETELRPG